MKQETYILEGFITASDWYNNRCWIKLHIETDIKGLQKIEKDPRQDYINFGVQSVDYAMFTVRKKVIDRDEKYTKIKEDIHPFKTIEQGTLELNEKEQELLDENDNIVWMRY